MKKVKTESQLVFVFVGYANELGESFKTHIPRAAYFGSYIVASGYAIGDASTKARLVYKVNKGDLLQLKKEPAILTTEICNS